MDTLPDYVINTRRYVLRYYAWKYTLGTVLSKIETFGIGIIDDYSALTKVKTRLYNVHSYCCNFHLI